MNAPIHAPASALPTMAGPQLTPADHLAALPDVVLAALADPATVMALSLGVLVQMLASACHAGSRRWLTAGYAAAMALAGGVLAATAYEGQDSPLRALPWVGASLAGLDASDVAALALLGALGAVAGVVTHLRWAAGPPRATSAPPAASAASGPTTLRLPLPRTELRAPEHAE